MTEPNVVGTDLTETGRTDTGLTDTGDQGPEALVELGRRFRDLRKLTEELSAPLSAEDQTVQSMPDVSPTKWHRGHTSWFFETFLLEPAIPDYKHFDRSYSYLFNSYYETLGPRHARQERGLITRPGIEEVARYRRHVDDAMNFLLDQAAPKVAPELLDLGIHHEQQHQELLLMDIKHVLSRNPFSPAYLAESTVAPARPTSMGWIEHPGGLVRVGHEGPGFAFDNEGPSHLVNLTPFALSDRLVTNGEWTEFISDGGYERPEFWLSEGWATAKAGSWRAPLYWVDSPQGYCEFTLAGLRPVDPNQPVCHISLFEADAFARWAGARLPTEFEWEALASQQEVSGNFVDSGALHPLGESGSLFGDAWQWTSSSYAPYPRFAPPPGAVGEYNGKFMVNQYVLRGGSCATSADHIRATYRNFFPAGARWAFSSLRLARDI
jgi:ergothioneine biosynthesis protein EgtB